MLGSVAVLATGVALRWRRESHPLVLNGVAECAGLAWKRWQASNLNWRLEWKIPGWRRPVHLSRCRSCAALRATQLNPLPSVWCNMLSC